MRIGPHGRGHLRSRSRDKRGLSPGHVLAVAAVVLVGGALVVGMVVLGSTPTDSSAIGGTSVVQAEESTLVTGVVAQVEVPALTGLSVGEAQAVLEAASLGHVVRAEDGGKATDRMIVVHQEPATGELASQGAVITLLVRAAAPGDAAAADTADGQIESGWVVCIDPGHQAHADITPEPIAPKSKKTKQRVSGGATGVTTKIPEYELTLQIATNLKKELESRGVEVVMMRTTNDVSVSNVERAKIANKSKADLFVRIHCDGSPDQAAAGVSTLYPDTTKWTKRISPASKKAAQYVQSGVVESTGAIDRGITPRSNLSGFNWAKVPSVLVECGFLSNPVEDRLLASPHYQDKLADGIADGVVAYLESGP